MTARLPTIANQAQLRTRQLMPEASFPTVLRQTTRWPIALQTTRSPNKASAYNTKDVGAYRFGAALRNYLGPVSLAA